MKIKVATASGVVLDWMVATAEGGTIRTENGVFLNQGDGYDYFTPSTDWAQGGPIIDREGILLRPIRKKDHSLNGSWLAMFDGENTGTMVHWVRRQDWPRHYLSGPTPLIAAMRCYVVSKLGEEVEVPKEILK